MKSIEEFPEYLFKQTQACDHEVPQQAGARRFIGDLVSFLFPIRADEECVLPQIRLNLLQLQIDFQKLLRPLKRKLAEPIGTLCDQFFDRIRDPLLPRLLWHHGVQARQRALLPWDPISSQDGV